MKEGGYETTKTAINSHSLRPTFDIVIQGECSLRDERSYCFFAYPKQ